MQKTIFINSKNFRECWVNQYGPDLFGLKYNSKEEAEGMQSDRRERIACIHVIPKGKGKWLNVTNN